MTVDELVHIMFRAQSDEDASRAIEALERYGVAGGDVNARTASGEKVLLYFACAFQQLSVIRLLAEHGADLNPQDVNGATALHIAADIDIDGCYKTGLDRKSSILRPRV